MTETRTVAGAVEKELATLTTQLHDAEAERDRMREALEITVPYVDAYWRNDQGNSSAALRASTVAEMARAALSGGTP